MARIGSQCHRKKEEECLCVGLVQVNLIRQVDKIHNKTSQNHSYDIHTILTYGNTYRTVVKRLRSQALG